jgi:hypothetical protein
MDGIRMTRYLNAVTWKWRALKIAVRLRGKKEKNAWRVKQPSKFVKEAEELCKIKINLLENGPELFPNMQHISGCSLQYIIMLNHLLGGTPWHKAYTNEYVECVPKMDKMKMGNLLRKLMRNV